MRRIDWKNHLTALKSLLYFLLVQNFGFYVPLAFFRIGPQIETGALAYLALLLWPVGTLTILWGFWDFSFKGHGTPAPIDPPKTLVTSALYSYVRNPIYMSVILILFGHFLWFGYWQLLMYAGLAFLVTHLYVTLYEEPNLRKRFGRGYEDYLREVPRWIPKLK
jgi:protein-S-isoprenylcysteine O-methyltransferase Ste14